MLIFERSKTKKTINHPQSIRMPRNPKHLCRAPTRAREQVSTRTLCPRRREGLEPPPRAKGLCVSKCRSSSRPRPNHLSPNRHPRRPLHHPKPKPPPPPQQYEIRIRHAVEAGPEITLTIWTNWTFDAVREALAKKLGRDDIRRKARFVFKASAGTSPWIAFKDVHLSFLACGAIQVVSGVLTEGPGDCWLRTRWLSSQRADDARLAA